MPSSSRACVTSVEKWATWHETVPRDAQTEETVGEDSEAAEMEAEEVKAEAEVETEESFKANAITVECLDTRQLIAGRISKKTRHVESKER